MLCKICNCYATYKFFKRASQGPNFDHNRYDY